MSTMQSTYTVTGMSCEHCVAAVTEEVRVLDGVLGVDIDLGSGELTIDSDRVLAPEQVRAAVEEAGYEVVDGGS